MCFSILSDGEVIYVGTVNGINKILFDTLNLKFTLKALKSSHQRLGPECNQNAILRDTSGRIWVGTTKGISIYQPSIPAKYIRPKLHLKSIEVYGQSIDTTWKDDTLSAWNLIPKKLILAPDQNHLTFNVTGISLSALQDLLYQYYLIGADTAYTRPKTISAVMTLISLLANIPSKQEHCSKTIHSTIQMK